jgi:hypothetical protein
MIINLKLEEKKGKKIKINKKLQKKDFLKC